jgi:SH3-like domain-containing protein
LQGLVTILKGPLSLLSLLALLTSVWFVQDTGSQNIYPRLVVTKERVNVRQDPSPGSPVLKVIKSGEELNQLEQKGNWYKVELGDGTTGWVHHTLVIEKDKAISASTVSPTLSPTHVPSVASITPGAESNFPTYVSTGPLNDHDNLFTKVRCDPRIIIGFIVSMVIILGVLGIIFRRSLLQRQLHRFLHKTLPCSMDRSLFPSGKSLFDILLDLGISLESITLKSMDSGVLQREPLCWVPAKGRINHDELNDSVKESVEFYGTYELFVTAMNASQQDVPDVAIPDIMPQHRQTRQGSVGREGHGSLERLIEARKVFEAMVHALCDETKINLARRLGIIHRFDYMTSQLFRSVAERENQRIAAS